MIIYGTKVEYDGKQYKVFLPDENKIYAVGAMVSELSRLDTRTLKGILMRVESFHAAPSKDRLKDAAEWFRIEMRKQYPPIICEMFFTELMNFISEFYDGDDAELQRDFLESIEELCHGEMESFVFQDTGYDGPGKQTVGHLLLSLYLVIDMNYQMAMSVFNDFVNAENNHAGRKNVYKPVRLSKRDSYLQQIDYKILFYDDAFHSEYKIKTIMSLCLFEMAHIYESNAPIVKCKNCGHYFRPKNRSDTRYCNYPAPDNPEKTCKEIGAQIAWKAKEKTDDITREYRKVYMRYKMKVNRHPDDRTAQDRLIQLTDGIKQWKQKLKTGETKPDEFFHWLDQY